MQVACSNLNIAMNSRCFCVDQHIPNLLAFPLQLLSLPKFPPYRDARLIAQDKASCIPAYLLRQNITRERADKVNVIDATSAPGNKTSYTAATLGRLGNGKIFAFERDEGRYETLRKMMRKSGCNSTSNLPSSLSPPDRITDTKQNTDVQTIHADFLQIDPAEEPYCRATHILVDPSCCAYKTKDA